MRIHTIYRLFLALTLPLAFFSCSDDDLWSNSLTAEQRDLIGTAVNFNASVADPFTSRSIYTDDGRFCDNDYMRIYRQYANENGEWIVGEEAHRGYQYMTDYAEGTDILLNQNWKVEKGRQGYNAIADALHGAGTFTQLEADSLTWENGQTVRFRAWSRSNYYNSITGEVGKERYYPDFCIADYVNSSGPSEGIPLVLNHMGSRISFSRRDGANEFYKIEICWEEPNDYRRADNNTTNANDHSEFEAGKTLQQAQAECDSVRSVYERMCMPAGVDIDSRTLMAMPKSLWYSISAKELRYLEEKESQFVKFQESGKDAAYIRDNVQRPIFNHLNGSVYLITVPYDMSCDGNGEVLTLPACTRFRVYLKDVNNGDQYGTSGYEGTYHILSLSDVSQQDANGNIIYETDANGHSTPKKAFPNGMILNPGYSYRFYVGYRYGQLTVTAEDNFSWVKQDLEDSQLNSRDEAIPELKANGYTWWKNAITQAIPTGTEDFTPVFHITSRQDFLEFIALVNGTATDKTLDDQLRSKITYTTNADNTISKSYQWYKADEVQPGLGGESVYKFYTQEELEEEGYIFYEHYHAANADKAAYSETDYLKGNYSFYDDNLRTHFKVILDTDLDFSDWELSAVGLDATKPFMGFFDGAGHRISNLNMGTDGYLFGYLNGGAIYNLRIESTHEVSLLKSATNGAYILGISLLADSRTNSIAESLLGSSFAVGCIHIGDGPYALVGQADNLFMYGCMQVASDITAGALLGRYADGVTNSFFAPQVGKSISWGRFMCNYYDKTLSPSAHAVASTSDAYHRLEYIRGAKSFVLKAKNDNLLPKEVKWESITDANQKEGFYGLAPWKAMNYAIKKYNDTYGATHKCTMHYESNTTGYDNIYPQLKSGQCGTSSDPTGLDYTKINPIEQNN